MRIIVITPPEFVAHEAETIARLLSHGIWAVHLRKPDSDEAAMRRLIEAIPEAWRPRLVLHDHFSLCAVYGLKGVHLNRRNPSAPTGHRGSLSRSVHSLAELRAAPTSLDYALLSPIFDSISKQGYHAAYDLDLLRQSLNEPLITNSLGSHAPTLGSRTFALGGVSLARLPEVQALGFTGAAMLGDVWQQATQPCFDDYLKQLGAWTTE